MGNNNSIFEEAISDTFLGAVYAAGSNTKPKKTLTQWYESGDISSSGKDIINKFGIEGHDGHRINDYMVDGRKDEIYEGNTGPEYALGDLKKLWYLDEIFERHKRSGNLNVPGVIKKMIFFSAWGNNNLIVAVNQSDDDGENYTDSYYHDVGLIVYEMPSRQMREILKVIRCYKNLEHYKAIEKARLVESQLKNDSPIIYKSFVLPIYYPSYTPYSYMEAVFKEVEAINIPDNINPDDYFKPLDIVKTGGRDDKYYHAGVYLGRGKIAHNMPSGVGITDGNSFVRIVSGKQIVRYHPVIPFKPNDRIIYHIAKCLEYKPEYDSYKYNCEHFANACVLGFNFSENREMRDGTRREIGDIRSIYNDRLIDEAVRFLPSNRISEIENYVRSSPSNSQGIKLEARIEVTPKYGYRLRS